MKRLIVVLLIFLVGIFIGSSNSNGAESLQIHKSEVIIVFDVDDIAEASTYAQIALDKPVYRVFNYCVYDNAQIVTDFVDDS